MIGGIYKRIETFPGRVDSEFPQATTIKLDLGLATALEPPKNYLSSLLVVVVVVAAVVKLHLDSPPTTIVAIFDHHHYP